MYSYYNVPGKHSMEAVMQDALILAKRVSYCLLLLSLRHRIAAVSLRTVLPRHKHAASSFPLLSFLPIMAAVRRGRL